MNSSSKDACIWVVVAVAAWLLATSGSAMMAHPDEWPMWARVVAAPYAAIIFVGQIGLIDGYVGWGLWTLVFGIYVIVVLHLVYVTGPNLIGALASLFSGRGGSNET